MAIAKTATATANAGEMITYTLTVWSDEPHGGTVFVPRFAMVTLWVVHHGRTQAYDSFNATQ